ncbi:Anaphase-promoting complex subunit 2 AltName: Full=20S cyclosome/APC complex protein apc2 [Serendipita indica DSM 11827]|nr:Anaphase-promoting complex subunit 2 AltName: Full=20S cyclosome/APC complex protein apc2 [Serendipita indica DSM 11827]
MATEAELRAIWEEKLQRISGGKKDVDREKKLANFSQIWDAVLPRIQPKSVPIEKEGSQEAAIFAKLADPSVGRTAYTIAIDTMRQKQDLLRHDLEKAIDTCEETGDAAAFAEIFDTLARWRTTWYEPFKNNQKIISSQEFTTSFNLILLHALPPTFPGALTEFLEATLVSPDTAFDHTFSLLTSLGLTRNFETLICRVAYRAIERRVEEVCPGEWESPCLRDILDWVKNTLVPWSTRIFSFDNDPSHLAGHSGDKNIGLKFEFHVYKTVFDLRVSELFDIISDVEGEAQVLKDLKECMGRVSGRTEIVRSIRQQIAKRLLHPGADTKDIIDFYISMIRCLRVIDRQGVLLFRVADPIRAYLRDRPDTISYIVSQLVDEKSELAQEAQAPIVSEMEHEDYSDPKWMPEPPDAGPKFRTMRPSDLISTLVSIYDSHELFIKELQTLFSTLFLQSREDSFDAEKRQLEILKLRFGDTALQSIDVMLADMQSAVRVHKQIQETEESVLKPAIISRWFWPEAPEPDTFKMPGQFAILQEEYNKRYQKVKPDKRLHWVQSMGTLKLTIELSDRQVEVNATPLEAAVIELFSSKSSWLQEELSKQLGVKEKDVLGALISWNEEGVLEFNSYTKRWILVEEGDASRVQPAPAPTIERFPELQPSAMSSREQQHWQHIKGALSNFGTCSTERIHKLMRYTADPITLDQLNALMGRLQADGLVEGMDSVWRLI